MSSLYNNTDILVNIISYTVLGKIYPADKGELSDHGQNQCMLNLFKIARITEIWIEELECSSNQLRNGKVGKWLQYNKQIS